MNKALLVRVLQGQGHRMIDAEEFRIRDDAGHDRGDDDVHDRADRQCTDQTDRQVADTLNRRGLRSGTGQPFRRLVVRHIRHAYGIPGLAEHLRQAGWLTATAIATLLRLHASTAKCWAREGILRSVRADDKGLLLFEPPTSPLPRPQQGTRFRDRRRYPQCAPHVRKEVQYEG